MAARSQRTKLTFADFGSAQAALSNAGENSTQAPMGTIIGWADGFVIRHSPDKSQEFEGMCGEFRMIPSDPKREEIESGVLFMGDVFHNMLARPLRDLIEGIPAKDGKPAIPGDPNGKLQFAIEVTAIKAKNPQGYSWSVQPLHDQAKNRLDEIAAALPQLRAKALEARRKPVALEAPKPETTPVKK